MIYAYIVDVLVNEEASYRLKHIIESKLISISTLPNGYSLILSLVDDIAPEFLEVRKITANSYVIIYRYYESADLAIITHIFHQTQDYGKIFQK